MQDVKELRRLALIMVVGFAATLGVLRWRDARDAASDMVAAPPPPAAAPVQEARPRPAPAPPAILPTAGTTPARDVPAAAPAPTPRDAEAPAEETATPPPPTLHVFVNRMRETERRRIRVANTGTEPVDCQVRIWRDGVVIGERQIELRFNTEVTLGVDDDLEVHAGDRIVVQSSLGTSLADVSVS